MAKVVQATCPRCRHVLRLPVGDQQEMRCEQCGALIRVRRKSTANTSPNEPRASATTTPQPTIPAANSAGGFSFAELEPAPSPVMSRYRRKRRPVLRAVFIAISMLLVTAAAA